MIIKGLRVSPSGRLAAIADHLFRGRENIRTDVLQGSEAAIDDAASDARAWNRTYAVRHWIVAPEEVTTRDQAFQVLEALSLEFGFVAQSATVIEHEKRRVGDAFNIHWHVIVPEVDPTTGRVLSSRHDYARHEKIARACEIRFGQKLVPGPHQSAVIAQLKSEGQVDVVKELEASSTSVSPGGAAFTNAGHQAAKRQGVDVPKIRAFVRDAYAVSPTAYEFAALLAREGLTLALGNKPGTWVVAKDQVHFVGAGHRLAGVEKAAFHLKMESGNVDEPAGPNRSRKHTGRHAGDTARCEPAGPDAHPEGQSSRVLLVDEPDGRSAREPVTGGNASPGGDRSAPSKAGRTSQSVWGGLAEDRRLEIGLKPYDVTLQSLQEGSRRLSLSSTDRLSANLDASFTAMGLSLAEIEQDLPLPQSLLRARRSLKDMEKRVSAATAVRDEAKDKLEASISADVSNPVWWSRFKRQSEVPAPSTSVEDELAAAEHNLRAYEIAARGERYGVDAEERSYAEANRAHRSSVSTQKTELSTQLALIDQARSFLQGLPRPWRSGYPALMAHVSARVERDRRRLDAEAMADFEGVPRTDIWGVGIMPRPR